MDLSLKEMYGAALVGIRKNPLIYLLLLLWGLVQGLVVLALLMIGAPIWLTAVMLLKPGENTASSFLYITISYFGVVALVIALLSAATRAGVLGFGARIRTGQKANTLSFLQGIFRFTWPLFVGGIIVGMLSLIPALAFLAVLRAMFAGIVSDVFTSGWNLSHAMAFLALIWNALMVAGIFQMLIFFWVAPWDEMVVLYELSFSEALLRSFSFVFSKRHFLRVLSLIIANVLIAQILLILPNISVFLEGLGSGLAVAYLRVLSNAAGSSVTSFIQFALLPFFAFAQLYLLPWHAPEQADTSIPDPTPEQKSKLFITV